MERAKSLYILSVFFSFLLLECLPACLLLHILCSKVFAKQLKNRRLKTAAISYGLEDVNTELLVNIITLQMYRSEVE